MNFDFNEAVVAHVVWKARLADYVAGKRQDALEQTAVARDDACALGAWLHGDGKRFLSTPKFRQLLDQHARFHRCASVVVDAFEHGGRPAAEALMGWSSEYSNASCELLGLLGDLRTVVEKTR